MKTLARWMQFIGTYAFVTALSAIALAALGFERRGDITSVDLAPPVFGFLAAAAVAVLTMERRQ